MLAASDPPVLEKAAAGGRVRWPRRGVPALEKGRRGRGLASLVGASITAGCKHCGARTGTIVVGGARDERKRVARTEKRVRTVG